MCNIADNDTIEEIFTKRKTNQTLSCNEILQFKTAFLTFVCGKYCEKNMALQLHYGCKRNNNTKMYTQIGADTGFDCIDTYTPSKSLTNFLDSLAKVDRLPKTILYSLNPNDNQAIDTIIGCFQDSSAVSKIQHGSAWWFNDNKQGMIDQLTSLANLGNLSGFIGMLTDSRSFLSYTRHEYFRRILCNLLGTWVENGEYPCDYEMLSEIVEDICYNNAYNYFGF